MLEELKKLVEKNIAGQGNQIDAGTTLPTILNGIISAIEEIALSKTEMIHSESNVTVNGYAVPSLTVEQVMSAYNAIVAGRACIIVDKDDGTHCFVTQADKTGADFAINYLYFNLMLITYEVDGGEVRIFYKELDGAEG